MENRRDHDRLPVSLWAVEKSQDAAYYHFITELSPGGLFLEKRLPLAVGTAVQLEFQLPTGNTIQAEGTVVREAENGQGNGIKFEKLSDEDTRAIEFFLQQQG